MPRQAQSALLQILNGNPNNKTKKELNKRLKNEKSLLVSAKNIVPPAWLNATAKKEFNRVVKLFKDTTLLNEADIFTLTNYADLVSEYRMCTLRLNKNKRFIDGKLNPDLRLKVKLSAEIDKLTKNLGLTPAGRASLAIKSTSKEKQKHETEDF